MYEPKGYNIPTEWSSLDSINNNSTLQFQENILHQLNGPIDFNNPTFAQYVKDMEKIHQNLFLGGTNSIPENHQIADSFIGELGLNLGNYTQLMKRNRYV